MKILVISGHRPDKLGGYHLWAFNRSKLKDYVHPLIERIAPDLGISGMAQGMDQVAAWVFNDLGIPWIAAVPFPGQEKPWPPEAQAHYQILLVGAKEIVEVCPKYHRGAYELRNRWMVDYACDHGVAIGLVCHDGSSGGTNNFLRYAREGNIPDELLNIFQPSQVPGLRVA